MPIEIVKATAAEIDVVSGILTEAVIWMQEHGISLWHRQEVTPAAVALDTNAGHYFLASAVATPAGTMRLTTADPMFWPEAMPAEAMYLHRLAVRRSFAGRGVSQAMLAWAVAHAESLGHRCLRLDCDATRPRLRAVYENFGFQYHSNRHMGHVEVARYEYATRWHWA